MTFRWFGSNNDTVPLHYVKQIPGVEGIVWALHDIPVGEIWPVDNIAAAMKEIEQAGFHGEVVESVNVHEDIKLGLPSRDQYIANYKQTIAHLAQFGVKVICYNFMPVFDWIRTNLHEPLEDGSTALFYEYDRIANNSDPNKLVEVINADPTFTMPGWEPERLQHLTTLFEAYRHIDTEQLFENARYFLQEIIPVAEQHGIRMAIHPDDPPWPVFQLPRIMTSQVNLRRYLALYDSPANALTLCSGSLGANPHNDIPAMIYEFADRIAFAHIRNVRVYNNGDFIETSHRTQDGSVDITAIIETYQTIGFEGYARPDHGRHIWDEGCRPGYGLYDRALGIMYLWGLWDAFEKQEAAQAPTPLTATI